jgi:hypothetical protein
MRIFSNFLHPLMHFIDTISYILWFVCSCVSSYIELCPAYFTIHVFKFKKWIMKCDYLCIIFSLIIFQFSRAISSWTNIILEHFLVQTFIIIEVLEWFKNIVYHVKILFILLWWSPFYLSLFKVCIISGYLVSKIGIY